MKNFMKKSIAGVLTMAMVLALAPTMAFAEEPDTVIDSLEELKTAISTGGEIALSANITTANETITIDKSIVLDGSNNFYIDGDALARYGIGFKITGETEVLIKDITFKNFNRYNGTQVFYVEDGQDNVVLKFENVTFENCADEPIYVEAGSLTVNNSTFKNLKADIDNSVAVAISVIGEDTTATITNNTFDTIVQEWSSTNTQSSRYFATGVYVEDAKVTIKNNNFTNVQAAVHNNEGDVSISNNTYDTDVDYKLLEGEYVSTQGELTAALASGRKTIVVVDDIGLTANAEIDGNVTITTAAGSNGEPGALTINSDKTLTVKDGGDLTIASGANITLTGTDSITVATGATLTIGSGVTISGLENITNNGTIIVADAAMKDTLVAAGVTADDIIIASSGSSSKSFYIKATATGNGTVAPEDTDVSPDSMYKVSKMSDVTFEFDADSGYEVTDVIVNGKSVGACDEYEFEDIIITMQTIEVVFEKGSSSSSDDEDDEDEDEEDEEVDEETEAIELPFTDIDEDNDNFDGIAYVYEEGIMAGITSEVFGSELSITRAMIAAILYRVNGSEPVDADMAFADVADSQYYYEAVKWGKDSGVMAGMSATEFAPNTAITNEQFIAFLYRYASVLDMDMTVDFDTDLSDYEISDYAYTAIAWALENDIIDEDDLSPTAEALRGDVATALMNFMEMM